MDDKLTENQRIKEFLEKINNLMSEYKYNIVPKIRYTSNGITPQIMLIDKTTNEKTEIDIDKEEK